MTDFAFFFTEERVVGFVLLFVRVSAFLVFLPFFSSGSIFPTVKAAIAFLFAIMFFPLLPPLGFTPTSTTVLLAVLTEIMFGFAASYILSLIFSAVQMAGDHISFAMSFSMATSMDPQSQTNSTVITQFLHLLAILIFLAFDGHHQVLIFLANSLTELPLGGFLFTDDYFLYIVKAFGWMFIIAFSIAFPIVALTILSDIVFGMIMKTVPSFNLLVVGIPAKIMVAFMVLVAVTGGFAFVFRQEFMKAYGVFAKIFF